MTLATTDWLQADSPKKKDPTLEDEIGTGDCAKYNKLLKKINKWQAWQ